MTRGQVKRRLSFSWWQYLALAVLPLFVINLVFGQGEPLLPVLAMPFFIAGVASMFASLRYFHGYKHALIATSKVLDSGEEPAAWIELARVRRMGMLFACFPAWVAALSVLVGLEAVPQILLALSTVVILYLYRIPRQLG